MLGSRLADRDACQRPCTCALAETPRPSLPRHTKPGIGWRIDTWCLRRELGPTEVRKETPSMLDAASIATRNEGTTKSGDVGERMESVVPPTAPMSSLTAPRAKRASD